MLDVGHRSVQSRINCCVLSMILVFLSPPKPSETRTLTPTQTTMLVVVLTPQQLARQVGGSVKCDSGSTVPEASCLIVGASGTVLAGSVRFLNEFSIMVSAFAPGQVLNFGSLAYIADY